MAWQEYVVWGMYWAVYAVIHLPQIAVIVFGLWILIKLLGILGGWSLAAIHVSKHLLRPVFWICKKTGLIEKHPWLRRVFEEVIWFGYSKETRQEFEQAYGTSPGYDDSETQSAHGGFDQRRYEQRKRERVHHEEEPQWEHSSQEEYTYRTEDFHHDFYDHVEEEQIPHEPVKPHQDSPWDILGVEVGASKAEIKKAYYAKVKQYHPDRVDDMGPEIKALAEQKMKMINQAWTQLQ